eukprot:3555918-Alexandrium_andersonii.AAC.1
MSPPPGDGERKSMWRGWGKKGGRPLVTQLKRARVAPKPPRQTEPPGGGTVGRGVLSQRLRASLAIIQGSVS